MHVRLPRIEHPGTPLLFFSLTLTFLLFFITVIFSFYLSILVLSTKIILSVVLFSLSLLLSFSSSFLVTQTLVHLSLSLHLSLPRHLRACFGYERSWNSSSNLAVNGVVLSKIVLYIKNDFLKKKNDLIVNKVLDSGGVLSQL